MGTQNLFREHHGTNNPFQGAYRAFRSDQSLVNTGVSKTAFYGMEENNWYESCCRNEVSKRGNQQRNNKKTFCILRFLIAARGPPRRYKFLESTSWPSNNPKVYIRRRLTCGFNLTTTASPSVQRVVGRMTSTAG